MAVAGGRYARDVEDTVKPGDFGLLTVTRPVGMGIRAGEVLLALLDHTGSYGDYEHAVVAVSHPTDLGLVQVVEAQPGGARLAWYHVGDLTWSDWDLTDKQRVDIMTAAKGYIGTPYSFLDYAAITAHGLHIPAPGLKGYIATTHHMICSQLVDQCYLDAGVHLFSDGRWPGYVTPADLGEVLHA